MEEEEERLYSRSETRKAYTEEVTRHTNLRCFQQTSLPLLLLLQRPGYL